MLYSFVIGQIDEGGDADADGDGDGEADADADASVDADDAAKLIKLTGRQGMRVSPSRGGVGEFLLGLLSPMSFAVSLAYFGCTGMFVFYTFPWMGYLSVVPAVLVSLLLSRITKLFMRWLMRNSKSSAAVGRNDIIGQIGEVKVPIGDGRTGEIVYTINSRRINASAIPAKSENSFQRGSKVIIVGTKDHVVIVEPLQDPLLEASP